jgi:putative transposase
MGSRAVVPVSVRGGARRSEAQWRALFSAFEASGETRRRFCARHGVALSTFEWWRRRLREQARSTSAAPLRSEALFVELTAPMAPIRELPGSAWDVELELGAGVVLRLRRGAGAC